MDLDLSTLGLGDSLEPETVVIVMIAVLGFVCFAPLLAMFGRRGPADEDSGHPLRSRLHTGNWE